LARDVSENRESKMARGDHLFIDCPGYSHHGIDCGDGRVIHFDSHLWRKVLGKLHEDFHPRVREASWSEFSRGRPVFIRCYVDSDDARVVIERARGRTGETQYDLWNNNCEHFAVWCKTGVAESTQVKAAVQASRPFGKGLAAAAIVARASRLLPPPARVIAIGVTVGASAAAATSRYFALRRRLRNQRHS